MLEPGIAQVDLAREPVEDLHLLDRIALHGGTQRLPDGAQQVDQDAASKQVVDLLLARAVPAHQPLQGGRLVWRVVVDVQVRVGTESLSQEVHQRLERAPFAIEAELTRLVARPEGMERAIGLEDAEQVVEAVVEGEWITLEVEEQVARRRFGQRGEAAFGIDRPGRPPDGKARIGDRRVRRPSSWIRACSRTRFRAPSPTPSSRGAIGSGRSPRASRVGDVATRECLALPAADAGDQAQVVVVAAALDALGRPAADVAVLDRLRIGRGRRIRGRRLVGHGREEPVARTPVVRHVVVDPEPFHSPGAATEGDVQPVRLDALDPRELVDVRADLEDRACLDVAGELGVGDLVVVRAPDRWPFRVVDAQQEVGVTAPGPVEERGLVDDVRARTPSRRSFPRRPREAGRPGPRSSRPAGSRPWSDLRPGGRRGSASRAGSRACG